MAGAVDYLVRTPRLTLRPFVETDFPALARIGADPRVAPMMGTIPVPWPEAEMRRWVAKSRFRGFPAFRVAVALNAGGLIGATGLGGAPASLAYFLDAAQWGRGYATEAAQALVADAFADSPGST